MVTEGHDEQLRVLNLVTSRESTFFRQQVRSLEQRGIACTTLAVSPKRPKTNEKAETRPVTDYIRFFSSATKESFGDYDLIHANSGLTAPGAVFQPNLPVVLSLWGSDLMGTFGPISKLCARYADAVIVMSQEMADELGRDCHIIPHGVDTTRFKPIDRGEAREALGWDQDATYVLFPYAASKEVKNFPRAERIVGAAREQFDGTLNLQTVYRVPHEQMPLYMNAADVLLLTSKREGSPNATKEALACNLPVVAAAVGDLRDQLQGISPSTVGETDEELIDGLLSIIESGKRPESREKVIHEMSAERMGKRIHEVYEHVLSKR
ncbi:glycosyltransferase [Haladaptatus sp. GCM10025707]|uniref:glycosyltransferase n=1 Tax=unclassified Haladaptatus TaxID=2622732 RepID=UPI0023E8009F|nr:glycosyltransferase [Haladaptatus sp. QDMS2]